MPWYIKVNVLLKIEPVSSMFTISLITLDSYQSSPLSGLDITFSDFRGTEIKHVPVIRIFGSTPSGIKTCLHVHGVFPYIYVPCIIEENIDSYMYKLASAIDTAINVSLGSTSSKNQHVYKIQQVSGIPLYGYHEKEHLFFKIYFYNPAMVKRAADLLQNGTILSQSLQPHEAHIPFILQFMIDYNLYGMSLIKLKDVKHRKYRTIELKDNSQNESPSNSFHSLVYLPESITRQSTCKLEVDAQATEILNIEEIRNGSDLNPGIAAIWNNEKNRREAKGLQQPESQLLHSNTNDRIYDPTDNDIYQEKRLIQRLQTISKMSNTTASVTPSALSYPLEVENENNILNASGVSNHFELHSLNEKNKNEVPVSNESLNIEELHLSKQTLSQDKTIDSVLDIDDMELIDMLGDLAETNEEDITIDNDSVLASQYSVLNNELKEDIEDDEIEDLNITSLDLDHLSSWNTISEAASQLSTTEIENRNEKSNMLENDVEDISLLNFPQYDGPNDLIFESRRQLMKKSVADITKIRRNSARKLEKKTIIHLFHKYITLNRLNFRKIQQFDDVLQKAIIMFQFNSNEVSDVRKRLDQILLECSLPKLIAFNTIHNTLFSNIVYSFPIHVNFFKKQICGFKNAEKRSTHIIRENLLHLRSKKMLNINEWDHQDLDVYDMDDIDCTSLINDLNLKNITDYNESHSIVHNFSMRIKIPPFDGNTVDSSSDSDLDSDISTNRQEKRICIYKSCTKTKTEENVINIATKKRKLEFEDLNLKSPKLRNMISDTSQSELYYTPVKAKGLQSPRSVGKYSPLNITIMSPKAKEYFEKQNVPSDGQCSSKSLINTPKRNRDQLRMSVLREKIYSSSSKVEQVHLTENNIETIKESTGLDCIEDNSVKTEHKKHITPKSNKEVRKRLSFVNTNNKEIDSVKDNIDENSEHLSLAEKITNKSYENTDFPIVPMTNFIYNKSFIETCTRNNEEVNYEDDLSNKVLQKDERENIENDENICNMTYTQLLSKKLESAADNLNLLSSESTSNITTDKLITITTKFNPPTRERIINTIITYNITRSNGAFFSNKTDLLKYKENSIKNNNINDVIPFKSTLDRVTGIKLWRRVKINEFYPSGSNIKSCDIKRVLTEHNLIVIQPLIKPPLLRSVRTWLQAKKYLLKKNNKNIEIKRNLDVVKVMENGEENVLNDDSDRKLYEFSNPEADNIEHPKKQSQISDTSYHSSKSNDSLNPSLQKMLENPLLHKNDDTQHLGISYGQIEYSVKEHSGNVADENFRNARGQFMHQYLTVLSLEIHVITRGKLLPDPEHDPIEAIFYAIYNDIPLSSDTEQIVHGAIVVNSSMENSKIKNIYSTSAMCTTSYVSSEKDLLNSLIILLRHCDPDILIGWEIESHSWGYILHRAVHIGFNNLVWQISRISNAIPTLLKEQTSDKDNFNDIKIPGRIVLDVWRIMRHEIALLNYTFENVMYHVLRERISCPTFQHLTDWWKYNNVTVQWKVISHYVIRVVGTLRILIHLDVIGRTCELARLFGIQFYEVFSRGSQFRVESMMLRLAKPLNYIPISPSVQQRAKMRAPESLPLIMEPQSIFYTDPLIVLDFQSLYPSIIIAYNYCFSTCLGRIEHVGQHEPFEFGAATLKVKASTIKKIQNKINFAPCGVSYVKPEVRLGILPRMLTEILNTRLMVKQSMKLHESGNRVLQRMLHSQQLGLKLIANVTYGYTSANFSGRMPCIEVGDSVVSKGRETLERAIKIVESTPKWGAQVVYGDTDSLFILLPGKSKNDAFTIGAEIADTVTAANPPPVKLKFEKVLQPSILQTKKRYCGYMYESPDQEKPEFLAKGIETVRRDGCPAAAKILEKSLKILFDTKDLSLLKLYVTRQFDKILRRKISIQELTFAKEFRGLQGYKPNACVPALELTRRLMRKDPRAIPRTGERVRYVIVAGAPNQPLIQCVRTPMEVILDEGLSPNSMYYVTKVIIPPLNRCLNLIGIDVNTWYREMSHRQTPDKAINLLTDNQKQTIRQFFSTAICAVCGGQSQKDVCTNCMANPNQAVIILHEKTRWLERTHSKLTTICQSCTGYLDDVKCESLDCPVLYRSVQARRDLIQIPYLNNIISNRDIFHTEKGNT
nr:DNA polymerase zeta catalytic subunit isoform X1 [Nomia melanderi]